MRPRRAVLPLVVAVIALVQQPCGVVGASPSVVSLTLPAGDNRHDRDVAAPPLAKLHVTVPHDAAVTLSCDRDPRSPVAMPTFPTAAGTHQARFRAPNVATTCRLHQVGGTAALIVHVQQPVQQQQPVQREQGIIGVAPNGQYFVDTATGAGFFPVGMDLAWPGGANSTQPFYTSALTTLAAAGANYIRVWLGPSQRAGSTFSDIQLQTALGQVDAPHAANVDWLLDECERLGVRALLALDSYNALCTDARYFCNWGQSVYNGPLASPDAFWTSEVTLAAFQNYTKYVVARWGSSPAVFAWQLWNEMDGAVGGTSAAATAWQATMVDFVAGVDGYHHLVTNSFAEESGLRTNDLQHNVTFTTTHCYESGDLAKTVAHYNAAKASYSKPTFVGEFGLNSQPYQAEIVLHNGLWGGVASLGAGTSMAWYWQTVLKYPQQYTAVAAFVRHLPLVAHNWKAVTPAGVPGGSVVRVLAVAATDGAFAFGWLQSMKHIWGSNSYPTVPSFSVSIPFCTSSSSIDVTWYNTTSGSPVGVATTLNCTNGAATFTTPATSTDAAFTLQAM